MNVPIQILVSGLALVGVAVVRIAEIVLGMKHGAVLIMGTGVSMGLGIFLLSSRSFCGIFGQINRAKRLAIVHDSSTSV